MTEANYTHEKTDVQSIAPVRRPSPDSAGLLEFLIGRIDLKQLDDEDLDFLSEASENAAGEAATLSRVVTGIACLISEEQMNTGMKSGALQDTDLPSLLWFISSQISAIGQMAFIGSEALYRQQVRAREAVASKKGARHG